MPSSIYFIGGASCSGKSHTASELARTHSRHLVELDPLQKLFKAAGLARAEQIEQTKKLAFHVVDTLAACHANCIVEGGWINPDMARRLQDKHGKRFRAVFCGFPGAVAEERYAVIKEKDASRTGVRNWLMTDNEPETSALEFLREQISGSRWYRDECVKFNFPFVDCSDIAAGAESLKRDYERHLPYNPVVVNKGAQ